MAKRLGEVDPTTCGEFVSFPLLPIQNVVTFLHWSVSSLGRNIRLSDFSRTNLILNRILRARYLEEETVTLPVMVGHYPPNTFVIKVGDRFYRTMINHKNKKSVNLRCRNHYTGCRFTAGLKILRFFDYAHPNFYDNDNFAVKPTKSDSHICQGYGTLMEARNDNLEWSRVAKSPSLLLNGKKCISFGPS